MSLGLMWYVGSEELKKSVLQAADHYRRKFGHSATLCLINPKMAEAGKEIAKLDGITIRAERMILNKSLWIGTED